VSRWFSLRTYITLNRLLGVRGRLAIQPLGHSTWSTESKSLVSQWLRKCIAEDSSLGSSLIKFLPTRLLCAEMMEEGQYRVQLCQGATLPRDTQYLTLSHRWGGKAVFCLLQDNAENLRREVRFESLSKTFQHAIIVTCDLGYRYIWIDSLCIIQDSQEDWLKEGVQMAQIYKHAVCNISAIASEDSHAGLFRSRNIETLLPLKVDVHWSSWKYGWNNPEGYIMLNEDWSTSVDSAPLSARGWVFQERLLSPRIIHFGDRQLLWAQADGISANEHWPEGIPFEADPYFEITSDSLQNSWQSMLQLRVTPRRRFDAWAYIIEDYSKRRFTYDTDKLAAISGIARASQEVTEDEYLAGLWKTDLLDQLLWAVCDPKSSSQIQPYTAPTWSWASMNGAIQYVFGRCCYSSDERPDFHEFYKTQLRDAGTSPVGDYDTGPVKAGFLRLKGPLRQAFLIQSNLKSEHQLSWALGRKRRNIYFLPDLLPIGESEKSVGFDQVREKMGKVFEGWYSKPEYMTFKVQSYMRVHTPSQSVFLLPIYCVSCRGMFVTVGLALTPTDAARGQFRREGLFFTPNNTEGESILGLPCDINCLYYEDKENDDYTVSII